MQMQDYKKPDRGTGAAGLGSAAGAELARGAVSAGQAGEAEGQAKSLADRLGKNAQGGGGMSTANFAETMRALRGAFPGRRTLRAGQVAAYLGIGEDHARVRFRYDKRGEIPLTRLARALEREARV